MTQADLGITELDVLSPRAATILRNGPPDGYRKLVITQPTSPRVVKDLADLTPPKLLDVPVKDLDDAKAMLAGLWLWFDALHESHALSQDLASPTGSFWHAIMHRREGDFGNAKYWYARCRTHRVNRIFGALTGRIAGDAAKDPLLRHVVATEWNGEAFVDLVEEVFRHDDDPRQAVAVRLQQAEWCALFHHCALAAAGSPLD